MKKSRFSDSQILGILKQAKAGTSVPALCREHGISSATFYRAKKGTEVINRDYDTRKKGVRFIFVMDFVSRRMVRRRSTESAFAAGHAL